MPQSRNKKDLFTRAVAAHKAVDLMSDADAIRTIAKSGWPTEGRTFEEQTVALENAVKARAGKPGDYTTKPGGTIRNARSKNNTDEGQY